MLRLPIPQSLMEAGIQLLLGTMEYLQTPYHSETQLLLIMIVINNHNILGVLILVQMELLIIAQLIYSLEKVLKIKVNFLIMEVYF